MSRAINLNVNAPFAFIGSFYVMLVGRSKIFLSGTLYLSTMHILGLVLCILAFLVFRDGLKLLGIINS